MHNSPHENNIVYSLHDELFIPDENSFLRKRSQRKLYDLSGTCGKADGITVSGLSIGKTGEQYSELFFVERYLHGSIYFSRHAKKHLATECSTGRLVASIRTNIRDMGIYFVASDLRFICYISHRESERLLTSFCIMPPESLTALNAADSNYLLKMVQGVANP